MSGLDSRIGPDPYVFRAIWGIPAKDVEAFDLLVARQLLWLPHAEPMVRRMLFDEDAQPICPVCEELLPTGAPSVICMAVLADRPLQSAMEDDPRSMIIRDPDGLEAWWLLHGDCFDELTQERVAELNQRIELALRAGTRAN
jgi:hypothetical protein